MPTLLPNGVELSLDTEITFEDFPTLTWYIDPVTKQIRGFTDELTAMTQAVETYLRIERYKFPIFSPNAGVEFEDLTGQDYGYITSEIRRRVDDAFLPDTRITGTGDFVFTPDFPNSSLLVEFPVYTVYGNLPGKLEVSF